MNKQLRTPTNPATHEAIAAKPAGHTPGPWMINNMIYDGAICRWHIASFKYGSAYPICEHVFEEKSSPEEQIANARLIAAAPELLEALKSLRKLHTDSFIHKGTDRHATKLPPLSAVVMADAAIAKAEGK